jgi:glycosyltransferase involved in cell wall biosynthesis
MTMDKRITVLFPITELSRDGAQRQLFELVKGLDKERFRPFVLTLNSGGAMETDYQDIPGLTTLSVEKRGKYDLFCLWRVFNQMRQIRAEVVQPFLTPATFYGLLPALWCRTPIIIVTERNAGSRKDMGLGMRLYVIIEDFFSRFADWAIPNSEAGKKSLIQRGIPRQRIQVISNGLDIERLAADREKIREIKEKYHIPPQSPVVGMTARFFPIKNHAAFFRMAELVQRSIPSARFALLGDGPLRGEMEDLSARLDLKDRTIFFGEQPEVGTYLSLFDIAVMTSDNEGCSNSILEAMASGKPVIATDVGGNREVIVPGENGFLVSPGDMQALADHTIELLRDPAKAAAMGRQARETALARFSLARMVRQYESLYETTLRLKKERRRKSPNNDER